jgi:1,4-dihydroxy-2-naphthoate octaprenyltransferase
MKAWLVIWFKAARAPFLVVSLLPALLGGAMAYLHGGFNLALFIATTVGIVMAHSAADFIDDYFDFKKGNLGNKVQQFHDSPLIDGKVTLKQVLVATALCLVVALGCGIYVFIMVGPSILWLAAAGLFIVFFYTSPPVMLNYRGLGETMLFLAFGPLIVIGVTLVLTGQFSWEALTASLIPGVMTMNVGVVSNTFDYHDDIKSGKRTMSVRFGQANAIRVMMISTTLAYAAVLISVIFGFMPIWALLVVLTLPLALSAVREASKYTDDKFYTPAMGKTIALSSLATLLLTVGYVLAGVLQR